MCHDALKKMLTSVRERATLRGYDFGVASFPCGAFQMQLFNDM